MNEKRPLSKRKTAIVAIVERYKKLKKNREDGVDTEWFANIFLLGFLWI